MTPRCPQEQPRWAGPLARRPSGGGCDPTAAQAGTWHPCPAPSLRRASSFSSPSPPVPALMRHREPRTTPHPRSPGKARHLTPACSVQVQGRKEGRRAELTHSGASPETAEAKSPGDSRAGPACSGSPGPRACRAGLRGDRQGLRGRTCRRPTARPGCKAGGGGGPQPAFPGHPTSPLPGDRQGTWRLGRLGMSLWAFRP